jgi:hypothetical protein
MSPLSYPFRAALVTTALFWVVEGLFSISYHDQIATTVSFYMVSCFNFYKEDRVFSVIGHADSVLTIANIATYCFFSFFCISFFLVVYSYSAVLDRIGFFRVFNWHTKLMKKDIFLVPYFFKIDSISSVFFFIKSVFNQHVLRLSRWNKRQHSQQQGVQGSFHGFKKLGFKVLGVLANSVPALYPNVQRI